jgi:hypothetical protein
VEYEIEVPDSIVYPQELARIIRVQLDRQPPGGPRERELASLLDEAYQASLRMEEGRAVRLRIHYDEFFPERTELTGPLIRFDTCVPCDSGALVRLAPCIGLTTRFLAVGPDEKRKLQIWGIGDYLLLPDPRVGNGSEYQVLARVSGRQISILGPGMLRVASKTRTIELQGGRITFLVSVHRAPPVREWMEAVALDLGGADEVRSRACGSMVGRMMSDVLESIARERHGGCILVFPDRPVDPKRVKILYQLDSNVLRTTVERRAAFTRSGLAARTAKGGLNENVAVQLEADFSRAVDLVHSLASVDGAVVLGGDLQLIGFAAKIEAEACPLVECRFDGRPPEQIDMKKFGTRHQSAAGLCKAMPGTIAFVVSQDGSIRVFRCSRRDEPVVAWDVVPGWVF